jgi:hypothetical protein
MNEQEPKEENKIQDNISNETNIIVLPNTGSMVEDESNKNTKVYE